MKKIILYLIASNLFMSQLTWAACSQGTEVQADGTCKYSENTLSALNNISECNAKTSGKDQNLCYVQKACSNNTEKGECEQFKSCFAKNTSDPKGFRTCMNENAGKSKTASIIAITAMGLSTVALFTAFKDITNKNTCSNKHTSAWLMLGGAGALALSEVGAYMIFSKRSKEIHEQAKELLMNKETPPPTVSGDEVKENPTISIENTAAKDLQLAAFDLMEKQEQAHLTAMTIKLAGYSVATALYLSAGILATVEAVEEKKSITTGGSALGECLLNPPPKTAGSGISIDTILKILPVATGLVPKQASVKHQKSSWTDSVIAYQEAMSFQHNESFEFDKNLYDSLKEMEAHIKMTKEEKETLISSLIIAKNLAPYL